MILRNNCVLKSHRYRCGVCILCAIALVFAVSFVVMHASGLKAQAASTYTVTFNAGGATDNKILTDVVAGSTVQRPAIYSSNDKLKELQGWYKDSSYTTVWDFSKDTMPADNLVLYAKWADTPYWLAPAYKMTTGNSSTTSNQINPNYENPEIGVIKTASEIKEDAATIAAGTAPSALIAEYNSYMTNDNYHLYTKYNNSTNTGFDDYMEFRIIQVGQHDSDGSGLTFQCVHLLPTSAQMNETDINWGGWELSALRKNMSSGAIWGYFNAQLKNDIETLSKKGTAGDNSLDIQTSEDKLWILSYSEITGDTTDGYKDEGSQYDYYSQVINAQTAGDQEGLVSMGTRSGQVPAGSSLANRFYWQRSPLLGLSASFMCVYSAGNPNFNANASYYWGVCPAFAFGQADISIENDFDVLNFQDQPYTGSKIEPKPVVLNTKTGKILTEGTDYTVAYYGNTIDVGTVSVSITGMGAYTGIKKTTFNIVAGAAHTISNSEYFSVIPPANQIYTGEELTPRPKVIERLTGKELIFDTDYTLQYSDNIEPGLATVLIKGIGNYAGQVSCGFHIIKNADPSKDLSNPEYFVVEHIANQVYTGSPICPEVKVIELATGNALVKDVDYSLAYSNNVQIGQAFAHITAIGETYIGATATTFNIVPAGDPSKNISNPQYFSVLPPANQAYTGQALTPEVIVVELSTGKTLINGTDYDVAYSNNIEPGIAVATIEGKGNYSGQKSCGFRIIKDADPEKDLSDPVYFAVQQIPNQVYTGSAICPEIKVTELLTGEALVKGTDYIATYSNNIEIGQADVYIVAIGATYTGAITTHFNIVSSNDESKNIGNPEYFTVGALPNQAYTGEAITPEPIVVELSTGKQLIKDTDYTVTYSNNIEPGIAVALVEGKGNYSGQKNCPFQIIENADPKKYIGNSSYFSIKDIPDQAYTGSAIYPKVEVIELATNESLKKDVDYSLVYVNNIEVGQATVYVMSQGETYTGFAVANFNIVGERRDIASTTVSGVEKSYVETGSEIAPILTVTDTTVDPEYELVEGEDYYLIYSDNVEPGTASIIITGKGKYTGTQTITFAITEKIVLTPSWERLAGGSALTTMKAIVNKGWQSSDWAVVATISTFHDALAASGIAGLLECPVLMTDSNELSAVTRNLIVNKSVKNVLIVGGEAAVSVNVENQIKELSGVDQVVRKGGGTAASTAVAIYDYGKTINGGWGQDAVIATSLNFQDALSIGSYSYAKKAPIFLTDSAKTTVRDSVISRINNDGFARSIIVGGDAVVEASTGNKLVNTVCLAGGTCYSTSTEIAKFCLNEGMKATNMAVSRGESYQDALAGAALLGKTNSIIVLVDDNKPQSKTYNIDRVIAEQKNNLGACYIFGGTAAVSQTIEGAILAACQ